MNDLSREIASLESNFPGMKWSVDVTQHDMSANGEFEANSDKVLLTYGNTEILKTASVGKIFLLAYVAFIHQGVPDLFDTVLPLYPEEVVADSGLLHIDRRRLANLTVADACLMVAAVSDNTATNMLLHYFGERILKEEEQSPTLLASSSSSAFSSSQRIEAMINRLARFTEETIFATLKPAASEEVRCHSLLLDQVRDVRTAEHKPTLSLGTASELSLFMAECYAQLKGVSKHPSLSFLKALPYWLQHNTDLSMAASAFYLDPLSHQSLSGGEEIVRISCDSVPLPENNISLFFNKTGTDNGVRADTGLIVVSNNKVISYAVLCNWDHNGGEEGNSFTRRKFVMDLMRRIGQLIVQ